MNAPIRPVSGFGRRRLEPDAVALEPTAATITAAPPEAIDELRILCLGRIDPAAVAAVPGRQLADEVERLIGEIATGRRIQLNGREQRRLAEELVDDMLGLGPLEPLLEDDSIADIMVDGKLM